MSKLLSAGFARLWKSKLFYLELAIAAILACTALTSQYREMVNYNVDVPLEHAIFNCTPFMLFFAAAFIALFTGSEYSDGTIRNKLVVGHARADVYLSNLIVNCAAVLIPYFVLLIIPFAVGWGLFGFFTVPLSRVLLTLLNALLMIVAACALFTLLAMLVSNKAANGVICLILVFLLFFAGMYLQNSLDEPEIYQNYIIFVDGVPVMGDPEPNPRYLTGVKRQVYQFLYDFLPMGQAIHVADYTFRWYYPLYSLLLASIATAAGLPLFRRKDIK
ncbi:MAG: ABC transporter permease [Butyricicoccus sp.]|nr:ABC transporter permease [Butyricicoccus sp.]